MGWTRTAAFAMGALALVIGAEAAEGGKPPAAPGPIVEVKLEHGVVIQYPKGWVAADDQARRKSIEKGVGAPGLTGMAARKELASATLLNVQSDAHRFPARLLVIDKTPPDVMESAVVNIAPETLVAATKQADAAFRSGLELHGMKLLDYKPMERVSVAGRPALMTQAVQTTADGNLYVRQYLIPTRANEYKFIFHLPVSEQTHWMPWMEHIVRTARIPD